MQHARLLPRLLRRLTIAAALITSVAEAREGRVVAIDVGPRVADALVVALSPWSLTVVQAPGPSPTLDFDAASARARAIAAEQHAGAVVWIGAPRPPDLQATLWVYDAETLQLAVRPLTALEPFDDAGAAAVALSVKTVLRASPLAAPEPPPEAPQARPLRSAATPVLEAPPATRSSTAWRVETTVGVRAPTGTNAAVEPRAMLGASLWPTALGGHGGFGLDVQAGPGVSVVATRTFQGELREAALEASARLRATGGRWFAFELAGGPGLFLTSLDGQAPPTGPHLHALRLDPSLGLGGIADVTPSARVSLGLLVDGSALLRFQRYALDGSPLLSGPGGDRAGGAPPLGGGGTEHGRTSRLVLVVAAVSTWASACGEDVDFVTGASDAGHPTPPCCVGTRRVPGAAQRDARATRCLGAPEPVGMGDDASFPNPLSDVPPGSTAARRPAARTGPLCHSTRDCCSGRCEQGYRRPLGTCPTRGVACSMRGSCCSGRCEPYGPVGGPGVLAVLPGRRHPLRRPEPVLLARVQPGHVRRPPLRHRGRRVHERQPARARALRGGAVHPDAGGLPANRRGLRGRRRHDVLLELLRHADGPPGIRPRRLPRILEPLQRRQRLLPRPVPAQRAGNRRVHRALPRRRAGLQLERRLLRRCMQRVALAVRSASADLPVTLP